MKALASILSSGIVRLIYLSEITSDYSGTWKAVDWPKWGDSRQVGL